MRYFFVILISVFLVACGGNQVTENPYASIPTYTAAEMEEDIKAIGNVAKPDANDLKMAVHYEQKMTEYYETTLAAVKNVRKKYAGYFRLREADGNLKVISLTDKYVESLTIYEKFVESVLEARRK